MPLPSSREGAPPTEPADTARRIVDLLADHQADDIVLLDIRPVAAFADYFIVASSDNPRQMRALVQALEKQLPSASARLHHQEGPLESGWVLLDYGAVVVHLFSPERREHYALEELWHEATEVVRIQ